MRKQWSTLALLFGTLCLLVLAAGCNEQSPTEAVNADLKLVDLSPITVRDYANYHNSEVEHLLRRSQQNGCLAKDTTEEFPLLMKHLIARSPDLGCSEDQLAKGQRVLSTLINLPANLLALQDIHNIALRCLSGFVLRAHCPPLLAVDLVQALALLHSDNPQKLQAKLIELQLWADENSNQEIKGVLGVFLGSLERSMGNKVSMGDEPWYWRIVIFEDVIGAFIGGPGMGALYSSYAEYMFSTLYPIYDPGGY